MSKLVEQRPAEPQAHRAARGQPPGHPARRPFRRQGGHRPAAALGQGREIQPLADSLHLTLDGIEILDHLESPFFDEFANRLFQIRQRKGWTLAETQSQLRSRYIFGAMMVREGLVDGQVHGIAQCYPDAIRPVLQVIPLRPGVTTVAGLYLMLFKNRTLLFADCTVNVDPKAETLAEIAILAAEMAHFFGMQPRVAMLSFSNFGNARHALSDKVARAADLARKRLPDLVIDGEMHADTALLEDKLSQMFPFNRLGGSANVLIFPDLAAGNIAYKLMEQLGGATAVGPMLIGPEQALQRAAAQHRHGKRGERHHHHRGTGRVPGLQQGPRLNGTRVFNRVLKNKHQAVSQGVRRFGKRSICIDM